MKDLRKAVLIIVLVLSSISQMNAKEWKIGVLAKRGAKKAMTKWKATANYLSQTIPGESFQIIPLDFAKVGQATANNSIDFILTNSSYYVELKNKHGVQAIVTLINSRQGQALKKFGGVIFTKANSPINSLSDIKGKNFMGVSEASFGGFQMGMRLLKDNGIDRNDFASLKFGKKHDNVVLSVLNGVVEVGTVRTDTIERMEKEGKIKLSDLKIINKQSTSFPFVCSTRLYPEWPLSKLKNTPDEIAQKVATELLKIKKTDDSAVKAHIIGWSAPMDYSAVDSCSKLLKIGFYK